MPPAPGAVLERAPFLLPATYTPALSPNFVSDGPRLRAFVKAAWRTAEAPAGLVLDAWQEWLIDRLLERYPADWPDATRAGRLRYRQVVVSIPRQNGKSVIGAILALYGLLMHEDGPAVIGVASTAEQARIVYDRVLFVVQSNPQLARRFAKMTETRGITTKDGSGTYRVKASKGDALQGIPASMSIVDELHITKRAIWQSLVNGTITRRDGVVFGITTAGDEDSELLKELYGIGGKAAAADPSLERFGFFVWQAPEATVPPDDQALIEALLASNPALYEGRIDIGSVVSDVRAMNDQDVIRYRFNLFVASQAVFIPSEVWGRQVRQKDFPDGRVCFTIDRTPDWGHASIVATVKGTRQNSSTHSEIVASIVRPTLEQLADLCVRLSKFSPSVYMMDGYGLRDLGIELKRRGLPVHIATQGDMMTASSLMFAKLMHGKLWHSGDELLARQIPRTIRKNIGEGFRISRKDSTIEIDAVIATALGVLAAETTRDQGLQIF